jgi:aminomethyltransferase
MLVVNGANIKKDWNWLNSHNKWGDKVELVNKSDEYSLLAV